jgi:hypothetical protein
MGDLILKIAPIAFFWALSPVIVCVVILLLSQENGIRKAFAFVLPSVVGSMAVGIILVATLQNHNFSSGSTNSELTYIAALCTGVLFLLVAGLCWWKIPRKGAEVKMPKWVGYIDNAGPKTALYFGLILFVNNVILTITAVLDILVSPVSVTDGIIVIIIFVIIGTLGLWIPVTYRVAAPAKSEEGIERARMWIIRHYRALLIFEFVFLGIIELVKGIIGLV